MVVLSLVIYISPRLYKIPGSATGLKAWLAKPQAHNMSGATPEIFATLNCERWLTKGRKNMSISEKGQSEYKLSERWLTKG
jgi:hypothetical protein